MRAVSTHSHNRPCLAIYRQCIKQIEMIRDSGSNIGSIVLLPTFIDLHLYCNILTLSLPN
jgi:hypothetical protein